MFPAGNHVPKPGDGGCDTALIHTNSGITPLGEIPIWGLIDWLIDFCGATLIYPSWGAGPLTAVGLCQFWRNRPRILTTVAHIHCLQTKAGVEPAAQMYWTGCLFLYWNARNVLKYSVMPATMGGSILANYSSKPTLQWTPKPLLKLPAEGVLLSFVQLIRFNPVLP